MTENKYTYEITDNGYWILVNGERSIHQYEPFIPDKTKSYEENAIAQIEEMKKADESSKEEQTTIESLQEQVTELQLAIIEMTESGV